MIYIVIYTKYEDKSMMMGKVFENGRSQAVRLPKECRFDSKEVIVNKIGNIVILLPTGDKWSGFALALNAFSDDVFSEGRAEEIPQKRENL